MRFQRIREAPVSLMMIHAIMKYIRSLREREVDKRSIYPYRPHDFKG